MDEDEREKANSDKLKPIPIRDAVGEPRRHRSGASDASKSVSTSQAPGLRGQRARPEGPRGGRASYKKSEEDHRPRTRASAASVGDQPQRPQLEPTAVEDLPSRKFEDGGRKWIVRLLGMTSTGSLRDSGALLMHLGFYAADEPLVSHGAVLVPATSLKGISDLALSELLSEVRSAVPTNESSR